MQGTSKLIIARTLEHGVRSVTDIYAHVDSETVREAVNLAVEAMVAQKEEVDD